METLTKENFWNEMEQKYPKAMAHFKQWIDKYKSEHDWDRMFCDGVEIKWAGVVDGELRSGYRVTRAPKYHELPIAMQFGIFTEYLYQVLNEFELNGNVSVMELTGKRNFVESIKFGLPKTLGYINWLIEKRSQP